MAAGFAAILLVCAAELPREACTEATAIEARSIVVDHEMGCAWGWQELIARAGDGAAAEGSYLKTMCKRVRPIGDGPG